MMDRDTNLSLDTFMGQPTGRIHGQHGIPAGFSLLTDGIYLDVAPN
jgi:hypothetical protein